MKSRVPLAPTDIDTLLALLEMEPATGCLLAMARHCDEKSVRYAVLRLQRKGLVSRRKFARDSPGKPPYLYVLTRKGRTVAEALAVAATAFVV